MPVVETKSNFLSTEHFATIEPLMLGIDVSEQHKVLAFAVFEALKLWNIRSGYNQPAIQYIPKKFVQTSPKRTVICESEKFLPV